MSDVTMEVLQSILSMAEDSIRAEKELAKAEVRLAECRAAGEHNNRLHREYVGKVTAKIDALEADVKDRNAALDAKDTAIEELRELLDNATAKLKEELIETQKANATLAQDAENANRMVGANDLRIKAQDAMIKKLEAQAKEQSAQFLREVNANDLMRRELDAAQKELEKAKFGESHAALGAIARLEEENTKLKKELKGRKEHVEQCIKNIAARDKEISLVRQQIHDLGLMNKNQRETIERLQKEQRDGKA